MWISFLARLFSLLYISIQRWFWQFITVDSFRFLGVAKLFSQLCLFSFLSEQWMMTWTWWGHKNNAISHLKDIWAFVVLSSVSLHRICADQTPWRFRVLAFGVETRNRIFWSVGYCDWNIQFRCAFYSKSDQLIPFRQLPLPFSFFLIRYLCNPTFLRIVVKYWFFHRISN